MDQGIDCYTIGVKLDIVLQFQDEVVADEV